MESEREGENKRRVVRYCVTHTHIHVYFHTHWPIRGRGSVKLAGEMDVNEGRRVYISVF